MTIALDLAYAAPTSLDEVLALLTDADEGTVLLAGGTDVVGLLRDDLLHPDRIIDLKRIPGLGTLEVSAGALHIGCLVTFTDLLIAPLVRERFPVLSEMAGLVASVGIRNRATVVGNLCSAVPSCDAAPPLLVHDAVVHTRGQDGARTIALADWFVGPRRTALRPGELVTHLTVPLPDPAHGAAFARLSRTRGEDLAQASVAVLVVPGQHHRVAFGAVAPTPIRAPRIEALLADRGLGAEAMDAAVDLVAEVVAPVTDVRATARYRLRMCEVMLRRALDAATGRAAGDGPALGTPLM